MSGYNSKNKSKTFLYTFYGLGLPIMVSNYTYIKFSK